VHQADGALPVGLRHLGVGTSTSRCPPGEGQKITVNADMSLNVPDQPIIPYIEGDGTGWTSRR
jgi:hypothetical protein